MSDEVTIIKLPTDELRYKYSNGLVPLIDDVVAITVETNREIHKVIGQVIDFYKSILIVRWNTDINILGSVDISKVSLRRRG